MAFRFHLLPPHQQCDLHPMKPSKNLNHPLVWNQLKGFTWCWFVVSHRRLRVFALQTNFSLHRLTLSLCGCNCCCLPNRWHLPRWRNRITSVWGPGWVLFIRLAIMNWVKTKHIQLRTFCSFDENAVKRLIYIDLTFLLRSLFEEGVEATAEWRWMENFICNHRKIYLHFKIKFKLEKGRRGRRILFLFCKNPNCLKFHECHRIVSDLDFALFFYQLSHMPSFAHHFHSNHSFRRRLKSNHIYWECVTVDEIKRHIFGSFVLKVLFVSLPLIRCGTADV